MARISLLGGAYSSRSVIANAQRCVNLYPEATPQESAPPTPVTHMLTPGLLTRLNLGAGECRGIYRANVNRFYVVIGNRVYSIDGSWNATQIGTLATTTGPVSMADNLITMVAVDGPNGYCWDVATETFSTIADPAFYGANRVKYLDGFFVFNRPNTAQFYLSPPFWDGVTPFDATYIASKTGGPDPIVSIAIIRGELWLLGLLTSEVWFNSGATDFPFERQPGVFIDHGMLDGASVAEADVEIIWLGNDRQGRAVIFSAQNYTAQRISTHAIEHEIQSYAVINDTRAFTYQQDGHMFYVLNFPTADKTWVYDLATKQWHERTWTDPVTHVEHRHRANAYGFWNDRSVVGDHSGGQVYEFNLDAYNDAGAPITRRRSFPHAVSGGERISYSRFIADMEVDAGAAATGALLTLRWSDTRGATYGTPVTLSLGGAPAAGLRSLMFSRLGMARDRVFELSWTFGYQTSLQGAWITYEKAET